MNDRPKFYAYIGYFSVYLSTEEPRGEQMWKSFVGEVALKPEYPNHIPDATKKDLTEETPEKAAREHRVGLEKVDAIFGQMTNPLRRIYANQYERSFLAGVDWSRKSDLAAAKERQKEAFEAGYAHGAMWASSNPESLERSAAYWQAYQAEKERK